MSDHDLPTLRPTAVPSPAFTPMPPGPTAGPGEDGEKKGPGLQRYINVVLRYKWISLGIMVVGVALGLVASRFASPTYEAEARLWLTMSDEMSRREGPIQSGQLLEQDSWAELATSYAVLDWVVQDQRLYAQYRRTDRDVLNGMTVDTAYLPGRYVLKVSDDGRRVELRRQDGILIDTATVGGALGRRIGLILQPPARALKAEREVEFTVLSPRDAAKDLSEKLEVRAARQGNFMLLTYSGRSAERVASVLNAVVNRYVEVAADLKRARLEELRKILESQLVQAQTYLTQSELALEGFRVQTITLPSELATPVAPGLESTRQSTLNRFFELKVQRDQLLRDAELIEDAVQRGTRPLSVDALITVASVQQSPELDGALRELTAKRAELRALVQRYTPDHPAVQRANADIDSLESGVIPRLSLALSREIRNRVGSLDGLVGSASEELRQIPPRVIDEARLRRAVQTAENLYNDLRQRYETARLAAETVVPDVSILDAAAVPRRPSRDGRLQLLLMAILASAAVAVMVPILLDRFDPKLQYADQISGQLRLPILGAIPDLRSRSARVFGAPDRSAVVEALRGVRLNLAHAYGSAGPMVITITSPGSGDGKTFLSANLGLTFAEMGLRTLVIDGDTRRGCMHHLLEMDRKPGLTDFLAGNADLESVIRTTSYEQLDVIPCGTRLPNSPELLSAPAMGDLLAAIRSRYHVILFDSPPLGAGVDPLVLATLSGNMLLVVRAGRTDRALAEAKLQMVERLPVRLLGAVLNGIREDTGYRYYSYLPGYEAGTEEIEDPARQLLQPT